MLWIQKCVLSLIFANAFEVGDIANLKSVGNGIEVDS